MQWTCQLVVKTGTPLAGEVDGPSPGGSNFVSGGEFSTPTVWLDKPLSRCHLRSDSRRQLLVPRHNISTYGRRAFSVAGPAAWNITACATNCVNHC